ncbi:MAG TPA: helix-turn-helix domain-containing protein [bacterium]|nr:helix-turn-helix domain-containing protein [bacterium]
MVTQDDLPIYPIRTVASLTGVDARRLRSWESEYRLLEPARSKGGHRLYSPRDLRLVHLIRRLVDQEGMSLQGIKAYLAVQPDGEAGGPAGSRDDAKQAEAAEGPSAGATPNGMPVGTRSRNGQHGRAERA